MVSEPALSFIGLEYFANRGDDLWSMADDELVELGAAEARTIGLFEPHEVRAGTVVRMPRAYPVYDGDYEAHLEVLRRWLDGFDNLYTVGRNGQHRYNNQDHSMLAGLYAAQKRRRRRARPVVDQRGRELSRRGAAAKRRRTGVRDRLTPSRVDGEVEALLRDRLRAATTRSRSGGAVGITASLALAVATAVLLLGADDSFVPMLSLLGNYLFGYEVSWPGLAVGMVEAGLGRASAWGGSPPGSSTCWSRASNETSSDGWRR